MKRGFIAREYVRYLFAARGIHSIHSPFVFDFVKNVLHDHRYFYCFDEIELLRDKLLVSEEVLEVSDPGAGSHQMKSSRRRLRDIVTHSSTPRMQSQFLFRLGNYFQCRKILELGTSTGLTSLYFSSISNDAELVTIEGSETIASIARKNFNAAGRKNIVSLSGLIEDRLPDALMRLKSIDLAYLDGNHRLVPTLNYFNSLLTSTHEKSVVVIGDIHWSGEMKEAWNKIIAHPQVTVSIDLFYLGIVFFRKELSKQHFVLRW